MKERDEAGTGVGADDDLAVEMGAIRAAAETAAAEPYDGDKPAAAIESDIARTRANLSETLDALERRLAPRHLLERGIDMVQNTLKGRADEVGATVTDALRSNPIPVALIGAGVGWLLLSRTRAGQEGGRRAVSYSRSVGRSVGRSVTGALGSAAETVSDTAGRWAGQARDMVTGGSGSESRAGSEAYAYARQKTERGASSVTSGPGGGQGGGSSSAAGVAGRAVEAGSSAYEAAGDYASRAGGQAADYGRAALDRAGDYAGQAGRQASAVGDRIGQVMEDYPLAVGALGFLAGALVAAALPSTRIENEWVGETSDELWDQAKDAGREAVDRVQKVASTAASAAIDAASDAARQTADSALKEAERQGLMPGHDSESKDEKKADAATGGSKPGGEKASSQAGSSNQTGGSQTKA